VAKAKENVEGNLRNVREVFEAYLQSVFTHQGGLFKEEHLSKICEIGPSKREVLKKLKEDDLVSFVPMEDLGKASKHLTLRKEKILKEVIKSYTYFADGDVLLAKITPCFENGKLGIARNLKNGVGFGSSEFIVFRPTDNIISEYLFYFLSREDFLKEGKKLMTGAVGHKRVSKEFIEDLRIPFPSLTKQKSIVTKLDALSTETKKLEAIYKTKLNHLEELKKSILKKAFNGEL
jgi:type I restriction enzyme S subunit